MLTLRGASKISGISRATLSGSIYRGDLKATKKQWEQKGNIAWCFEIEEDELNRYIKTKSVEEQVKTEGTKLATKRVRQKNSWSRRRTVWEITNDHLWARRNAKAIVAYYKSCGIKNETMRHFKINNYGLCVAFYVEGLKEECFPSMLKQLERKSNRELAEVNKANNDKSHICDFCGIAVADGWKLRHIQNEHPDIKIEIKKYRGGSRGIICKLCSSGDGEGILVSSVGALCRHYQLFHPDVLVGRRAKDVVVSVPDDIKRSEIETNGNTFYANMTAFLGEVEQNKILISQLTKENESLVEKLNLCNSERENYQRKIVAMQQIMGRGD